MNWKFSTTIYSYLPDTKLFSYHSKSYLAMSQFRLTAFIFSLHTRLGFLKPSKIRPLESELGCSRSQSDVDRYAFVGSDALTHHTFRLSTIQRRTIQCQSIRIRRKRRSHTPYIQVIDDTTPYSPMSIDRHSSEAEPRGPSTDLPWMSCVFPPSRSRTPHISAAFS